MDKMKPDMLIVDDLDASVDPKAVENAKAILHGAAAPAPMPAPAPPVRPLPPPQIPEPKVPDEVKRHVNSDLADKVLQLEGQVNAQGAMIKMLSTRLDAVATGRHRSEAPKAA